MLDRDRPDKQSEARIDPAARQGMRRFMGSIDADGLTAFVRDCLRAVDRKVAVAIYNDNVSGLPMPSSSDRGRVATVLRGVLRAGRPDGFECLQGLTTQELEDALDNEQYEAYSEAVEALNEAVEQDDAAGIAGSATQVVAAMRAGLDDAAIERFVRVHALPETIDALMAALVGEVLQDDATQSAAGKKATKKAAAKKTATKKTVTKKAAAKKTAAKKGEARRGTAGKGGARSRSGGAAKSPRKSSSARAGGARKSTVRKVGGK
jgi:hypothetical protein